MANQNQPPTSFQDITHICCIGAREASVMSMAVIAHAHPQVTVTIVDYDINTLERWLALDIDFKEPGFQHLLDEVLDLNLFFSPEVNDSINEAHMIFIGVEIPSKKYGSKAGSSLDRTQWESAMRSIMTASEQSKVIVEKTTMPIDAFNDTATILGQRTPQQPNQVQFAVFSNPDFYSPGRAIEGLTNPDQVIIARKSIIGNATVLRQMYEGFAALAQHPDMIIELPSHVSVDLAKIATSVVKGAKITLANTIASCCNKTGANYNHVRRVVGGDYMDATLEIGGPDIMKDKLHFEDVLQQNGLKKQARLVNQMVRSNKNRSKEFVKLVLSKMFTLRNKIIAVFGVTYKSNIPDLTNSPAIDAYKQLLREGAILRIFDPLVTGDEIMGCFRNNDRVEVVENQQATYDQAHATLCLVATNLQFNFEEMRDAMVLPPYLFIACNLNNINYGDLRDLGFQYYISN